MTRPRVDRFRRWVIVVAMVLGWTACNSGSSTEVPSEDPVIKTLSTLPFDNVEALGTHQMDGQLTLTDSARNRTVQVTETYNLLWDGWKRYSYRITKDGRSTFDVTIVDGVAYQARRPGKIRARENLYDFHFYLQQTWNLWAQAVRPFGTALTLQQAEEGDVGGRTATRYEVGLREQALLLGETPQRRGLQTLLVSATGFVWVDKATQVPLAAEFNGQYKTIQPSRAPGRNADETSHDIQLNLTRSSFGAALPISAPEVTETAPVAQQRPPVIESAPPPEVAPAAPVRRRPKPQKRAKRPPATSGGEYE